MTLETRPTPASIDMAWNGWGDAARKPSLAAGAVAFLESVIGPLGKPTPSIPISDVRVGPSRLTEAMTEALAAEVGADNVVVDDITRILRSGGKSYPDLIRRRTGDAAGAPDAVVLPADSDQVAGVIRVCEVQGIAIVPFGGGTSVVGGVEPLRGRFAAVIALDLRRMDALLGIDPITRTATFQPGIRGPQAEAALNERGYTLGHFPQSYEHASIGGYAATRSAGQASSGYGRSDEMITGLELVTPRGPWRLGTGTPNAAGPGLLAVAVGSEGTLGVISEVTMRVRPKPVATRYEGWFLPGFAAGCQALRTLEQAGHAPDVLRLSDEDETRSSLVLSGVTGVTAALLDRYLTLRKIEPRALAITGWLGNPDEIEERRRSAAKLLRAAGAVSVGKRFGDGWEHGRYAGPYLRDTLMDHAIMVETLETATTWSKLAALHSAVRAALTSSLTAQGTPPLVLCHVSHVYPTGASLYFTFIARRAEGALLEQWEAAKAAACDAIVEQGATITHHHAVGADHRRHVASEIGPVGVRALRAIKAELDPIGVLNPDKLLPSG